MPNKTIPNSKIIYVRIPEKLLAQLDALVARLDAEAKAAQTGPVRVSVSRQDVLAAAIERYIQEKEFQES